MYCGCNKSVWKSNMSLEFSFDKKALTFVSLLDFKWMSLMMLMCD